MVKALSESAFMIIDLRCLICNQNNLRTYPRGGKLATQKVGRENFQRCKGLIFINPHVFNLKLNWKNAVVNFAA